MMAPLNQPTRTRRGTASAACLLALATALSACGGDDSSEAGEESGGGDVSLQLAHSYTEDQPQHRCGAQVIADTVADADVGLTIEIFPASQLGADADRIASVVSGDIDMDIQGASALGAVYEPVAVLDAAYAFDDSDHLARYFDSDASEDLLTGFEDETGVHTLGAWSAGMRQFTANEPIREPGDLEGLRMRFPNSPQFLMNAEALGADATEVAYEELFLALQQGTVDGQENPITNIKASNLQEVQDYISMSNHQANSNLVIIGADAWNGLSEDQQEALGEAVDAAEEQVPQCVADDEETTLAEWAESGDLEVVDDVDVETFRTQVDTYLRDNFDEEQLAVYEAHPRRGGLTVGRRGRDVPGAGGRRVPSARRSSTSTCSSVTRSSTSTFPTPSGARTSRSRRPPRGSNGCGTSGSARSSTSRCSVSAATSRAWAGWPSARGCSWSPPRATTRPTRCRRTSTPTAPVGSWVDRTRWWSCSRATSSTASPAPRCARGCSRSSPTTRDSPPTCGG